MSQVKSKNTKPELFIFESLDKLNIPYLKHYPIPGKPDIAFPDKKVVVFIDGEFWHGRRYKEEKDKYTIFWIKKIGENIKRDKRNFRLLKTEGWKVIRIWDKDLKRTPEKEIGKILKAIQFTTRISKSE